MPSYNGREFDQYVEGLRGAQRALFERNSVVFLGVVDGRPMPDGCLRAA